MQQDNYKHTLKVEQIELHGFPMEWADEDCDLPHSEATIEFSISIDARNYGIKSIYVLTNIITITIGDRELKVSFDTDSEWDDEQDIEFEYGSIVPSFLVLDYNNKTANISYT